MKRPVAWRMMPEQLAAAAVVHPPGPGRGIHGLIERELDPVAAPFELNRRVGVAKRPVLLMPLDARPHRQHIGDRRCAKPRIDTREILVGEMLEKRLVERANLAASERDPDGGGGDRLGNRLKRVMSRPL